MAADGPPFSIKLRLFPGAQAGSDASTWGLPWDASSYIRYPGSDGGQPITYTAGRADEASQVDASTMTLTLDNRDGRFSTKNVLGPKYGLLRRGTPIVMGVTGWTDTFTRSPGSGLGLSDSGHPYTTSGSITWTVDGTRLVATAGVNFAGRTYPTGVNAASFELRFDASASVVATGDTLTAAGLQGNTSGFLKWEVNFKPSGVLEAALARTGTDGGNLVIATATMPYTYSAGQVFTALCQRVGNKVMMKLWPASGTEPSSWTIAGEDAYAATVSNAVIGFYHWRKINNTNTSPSVFFDNVTLTPWEFIGNVVSWPTEWDKTGRNCWAPIEASGILRRLQQGKGPLRSPLSRQLPSYNPTGYWPLEDTGDSQRYASKVSGVPPAVSAGVTAAAESSLAGGAAGPALSNTNGFIRGSTPKALPAGSTGFSAMVLLNFSAGLPASKQAVMTINTTGAAQKWVLSFDAGGSYLEAFDRDGTLLSSQINAFAVDFSQWTAWQLETDISGSNTTWVIISHTVGAEDYFAAGSSHAGNAVSTPRSFTLGGSNLPAGTAFEHMWLGPNTLPFVSGDFSLVSSGYVGETASARLARLAREEGVSMMVEPGDSDPLGVQPQSTLLQAFRSAADSDMGILYERANGLGYRPRSKRYSQPVMMTLAVSAGQIDQPPRPIDDDQRLRNQWTVSQDSGSSVVARDDGSVFAEGLFEDSITISVPTEDQLAFQAGFRVYLGTWPDLRWPGLSLDLARNPSLINLWRSAGYGFRLKVITSLTQIQGSDPDVIAEGYSATLWPHGWKINLNCSTATAWDITTIGDDLTRLAADGSVLDTAVPSATYGSIQVDIGTGRPWIPTSIGPAEVPFLIMTDGEIMRVTNVGNVFSGTKQTLTVDRGINGGAKAHDAGLPVDVAYPMILAY